MRLSGLHFFVLSIFLFSLLQRPTFALKKSYVVYLGGHSHGPELSAVDLERVTQTHYDLLGSYLGSTEKAKDAIFYSYNKHINGFAAMLEEEEAEALSKNPRVLSVFLNKERELHTTRSWNFLGLENNGRISSQSIWKKARFGEDTIIANLDTGVWPESKSFKDDGMGPVPSRWKGFCQNNTKAGVPCNRKLIGARYFNKGYLAAIGNDSLSPKLYSAQDQEGHGTHTLSTAGDYSARDEEGHGTHTLSTAGGNFVRGASVFGHGNGTAKGGSPKARVAAYKVCWPPVGGGGGCFDADIMAAFDAAIQDGVDVLSVSLGGPAWDYFYDGISIGSFHAVQKGIVVVASAGNSGPSAGTVSNLSPWILTVGASTMDREFSTDVMLRNHKSFKGQSLSAKSLPANKYYPLISAASAKAHNASAEDALLCLPNSLDPKKAKGKILACLRGLNARVDKGAQAAKAGAVGMILCNDDLTGNEIIADAHVLPASQITYTDGVGVFKYINSTKRPMAYLTPVKTKIGTTPAPFMASFSSRGPNFISPEILKPDITAPGVSVIAAYTLAVGPTGLDFDKRRVQFNTESGTSMSCPHISGVVGLLKTLHPDWSPSAIKSAIMTSSRTRDNNMEPMLDSSSNEQATPFDYGAGHVRPNRAADPGLVYDLTTNDYLNFLCGFGYNETQIELFSGKPYKCPKSYNELDLNYPSITVPNLSGSVTVTRRVKNVGAPSTYHASVHEPAGISVSVEPKTIEFKKTGEEKEFKIHLNANHPRAAKNYVYGQLRWSDGEHIVRSPIVVKATEAKKPKRAY